MPSKYASNLRKEQFGYFPYPIIWVDGKWVINIENKNIPLGSEIISINDLGIEEVIKNIYKYYTTDGDNKTGKKIGIRAHFSKYFRINYGLKKNFKVVYKEHDSKELKTTGDLQSVSYINYYKNFNNRHSKPFDGLYYADLKDSEKYNFKKINNSTGILTIRTFSLGNENSKEHKTYVKFLEETFLRIKNDKLKNLIVDVRQNGGGTDPNDLITYSYLSQRNFQENKQAWISFRKIPHLKYYDSRIPTF